MQARSCMYCGATLSPGADGRSIVPAEMEAVSQPPLADSGEAEYMLMIIPSANPEQAAFVADLVGVDAFLARQRFLRRKPFVAVGGLLLPEAVDFQSRLATEGLRASVFSESMVEAVPEPLQGIGGDLEPIEARIEIKNGDPLVFPYESLLLVVQGEITEKRLDVMERQRKIHVRPSGMHYQVKLPPQRSLTHQGKLVADLYVSGASGVRLSEDHFVIPGKDKLARRQVLSGFLNELRERAPEEVFDCSFGSLDAVTLKQRYRAERGTTNTIKTQVSDNREEFDTHSACLFLHVAALKGLLS